MNNKNVDNFFKYCLMLNQMSQFGQELLNSNLNNDST